MKKTLAIAGLAAASSSFAFGPAVQSWTGGSTFPIFYGGSTGDAIGYFFQVTEAVMVDALGVWNDADGLGATHDVGIWNVATGGLIASASVNNGGTLSNNFYYTAITPVMLSSGVNYVVAAVYTATDGDSYVSTPTTAQYDPMLIHQGAAHPSAGSLGFTMPTVQTAANRGRFGPNMNFAPVPEPGTLAAVGVGLAFLLRRRTR